MALDVVHSSSCTTLEVPAADVESCLCSLIAFVSAIKGTLEITRVSDHEISSLLELLLDEWLTRARPSYVPEAAYYAVRKSGWVEKLVEVMGEDALKELLEVILHSRTCCEAYESFLREFLSEVAEAVGFDEDSRKFIQRIAVNGSCEDVRSVLALVVALKPVKG